MGETEKAAEPWYAGGLAFECTRCGNCCTGDPGFVWVNEEEIAALAKFRGEPLREVKALYTRAARGRVTLREKADGDCVFYDRAKGCTVYPVRPRQCRTWPFWECNVTGPEDWARAAAGCPGCNQGELIPADEITRRVRVVRI